MLLHDDACRLDMTKAVTDPIPETLPSFLIDVQRVVS